MHLEARSVATHKKKTNKNINWKKPENRRPSTGGGGYFLWLTVWLDARRGRCCCRCWCGVCGHRQQHRRMAGCQVAVPGTRFPLPIPVPVTVPNSHFPQFPFPSRVSNNFAESGGLKHERASHTKDIHRYTHTHLYMYMCACIVCAVFMRLMTDSLHFRGTFVSLCPVASPAQPCPASVFIFVYKHNEIASGRRCDACHGHYSIYTRLPKSHPLPLPPSLAYPTSSLSSIAVSLDKRLSN